MLGRIAGTLTNKSPFCKAILTIQQYFKNSCNHFKTTYKFVFFFQFVSFMKNAFVYSKYLQNWLIASMRCIPGCALTFTGLHNSFVPILALRMDIFQLFFCAIIYIKFYVQWKHRQVSQKDRNYLNSYFKRQNRQDAQYCQYLETL